MEPASSLSCLQRLVVLLDALLSALGLRLAEDMKGLVALLQELQEQPVPTIADLLPFRAPLSPNQNEAPAGADDDTANSVPAAPPARRRTPARRSQDIRVPTAEPAEPSFAFRYEPAPAATGDTPTRQRWQDRFPTTDRGRWRHGAEARPVENFRKSRSVGMQSCADFVTLPAL